MVDLIGGDVYTSEVPWTKPSEEARFMRRREAVKVSDPSRCVYVGDRLFDDVYGAQRAGLRAPRIPHSNIPSSRLGHREGSPDAVAQRLSDIHQIARSWE